MLDTNILVKFAFIHYKLDEKVALPKSLRSFNEILKKFETSVFSNIMSRWNKLELRDVLMKLKLSGKYILSGFTVDEFRDAKLEKIELNKKDLQAINDLVESIWKNSNANTDTEMNMVRIEEWNKKGFSLMDLILLYQAGVHKCDYFVTQDNQLLANRKTLSKEFNTEICNTKELIELLKQKKIKYSNYEFDELKKFTDEMFKTYQEAKGIKQFCTVEISNLKKGEFFQIGQRTNLLHEFFTREQGVYKDNNIIAKDFGESVVNGEEMFVLKSIVDSKKDVISEEIPKFDYSELSKAVKKLKNPTDIFFPIEPFFKLVHKFLYENSKVLKFNQGDEGTTLLVGEKTLRVHWIRSIEKIDEIIVLNKNKIKIIQKLFNEAEDPKYMKLLKQFKGLSSKKELMLYFGEKDEKNLDFLLKTVISKPSLSKDSAILITVKK